MRDFLPDHSKLQDALDCLENKAEPTPGDRAYLFDSVFRHYEALLVENPAYQKSIKQSLLEFLILKMPAIAKSLKALQRSFERKLRVWKQGGRRRSALLDKRLDRSGNYRQPSFAEDKQKLLAAAVAHGGNESLAYRKLRLRGELSEEFCNYYHFDVRDDKSYVPRSIRAELTPKVEMVLPEQQGPHEAKMRGPYILRDWSGVLPADYFSADDVTWNHYFWFTGENGCPQISRGECLLMMDLRTGYPLQFLLITGKYNSRHIRSLVLRVHDENGLPRKGFYFERGVWASRLIEGDTQTIPWIETEAGLRDQGLDLEVRHATMARSKPIEGLLRILQDRMQPEPGYIGPDEKKIKYESTQDFLARVRRGKEHPANEY